VELKYLNQEGRKVQAFRAGGEKLKISLVIELSGLSLGKELDAFGIGVWWRA